MSWRQRPGQPPGNLLEAFPMTGPGTGSGAPGIAIVVHAHPDLSKGGGETAGPRIQFHAVF
jgi:hypothetical protein